MSRNDQALDPPVQGLSGQAASSALWNGGGSAGVQIVALATYVVIAWTLGPEEFGTVAMAMALAALFRALSDFGLAPAFVTGRIQGEVAALSAHWLLCAWGTLCGLALIGLAPFAADFFHNPAVRGVLVCAALLPVFDAAAKVPQSLLQAAHRFDRIAIVDLKVQLGIAVAAISMATLGFGVWSLVLPQVVGRGFRTFAICRAAPLRYRACFSWRLLRGSLREGGHVMGAASTQYLFRNADDVMVGRFFGAEDLGRYSFAYNCLARALSIFSHAASMPILASLGRLRGDAQRFDRGVVRAARTVARITFPLTLGAALLAPLLIEVFFGSSWQDTAELMRIFLPLAAVQSIGALSGSVWLAQGRSQLVFRWGLARTAIAMAAFALGVALGSVESVALSFALCSLCVLSPAAYQVTRRVCGLPLEGLLRALGIVLLDVLAMLGTVALVGNWLEGAISAPLLLALQVMTGALAYGLILRTVHPAELSELLALVPGRWRASLFRALQLDATAALAR